MRSIKLSYTSDTDLTKFLKEGNKIVRIAFNLSKKGKTVNNIVKIIKNEYNNIDYELLDNNMIEYFSNDGAFKYKRFLSLKKKTMIFGSNKNWKKFQNGTISKDSFNLIRNSNPLMFIGRKGDYFGNRKFKLNIQNNEIIFKHSKGNHHSLKITPSKNIENVLYKLQLLSETTKTPITYKLDKNYIIIIFDDNELKNLKYNSILDRVASLDLNPNNISLTIQDFSNQTPTILHKKIYNLKLLNRENNSNKVKHELFEICKNIIKTLIHYKCEIVGTEMIQMKRGNYQNGKFFNTLLNVTWKYSLFKKVLINNLSVTGIKNQEIAPQYSSTIGCLNHPEETDSIAAALEIGRRTYMFKKKFLDKDKHFLDKDIIYPTLDYKTIRERWNSILGDYNPKRVGWVGIHNYLKEKKKLNELRFLFKDYDFSSWSCFSLKSDKSLVSVNET